MALQTEFLMAINQIAAERGVDADEILEAIKQAIRTGYKRDYPEDEGFNLKVEILPEAGQIGVFADKKVVAEVTNPTTQISLADARKIEPKLKIGDHIEVDVTPDGDFGRVAAQAARQVIMQKIRESEKESVLKQFNDKMGEVESAVIQRVDREGNVFLEINRATAIMPPQERIPNEFYKSGARIKVLLQEIEDDAKGRTLLVSRSAPDFLKALFTLEVPEIASGTVEIMNIAREAGSRSKVAVRSNSEGVDPIGSCVGQRGVRINAITNELKFGPQEEKIDIINWNEDIETFISNAIKPADAIEVRIVDLNSRQALILVNDEALSLAIGKEGQNVRLAAKLTGWRLDIQGAKAYEASGKKSIFEKGRVDEGVEVEAEVEVEVEEKAAKPAKEKKASKKAAKTNGLADLGLGARIEKSLEKAGITDVDSLKAKIEAGESIDGVGEKSVEKIKESLGL